MGLFGSLSLSGRRREKQEGERRVFSSLTLTPSSLDGRTAITFSHANVTTAPSITTTTAAHFLSPPSQHFTCGRNDITALRLEVVQLEAPGQREVGGHLDGLGVLPAVDEVVHRPTV